MVTRCGPAVGRFQASFENEPRDTGHVFPRPSEVGVKQFYLLEGMEIKVLLKLCWNIQVA